MSSSFSFTLALFTLRVGAVDADLGGVELDLVVAGDESDLLLSLAFFRVRHSDFLKADALPILL